MDLTLKNEISLEKLVKLIEALTPEERSILKKKLEESVQKSHKLTELEGLGSEVWRNIDVEEYIDKERDGWS